MTYWWVNQSKTYQAERDAGIMWAPQQTGAGRRLGHWTAMTQLQQGDMVMHYARGAIRALGRIEAPAIAADRPYGLPEIWQSPGWMVPVRYFDLAQPIQRDELPLEWRLAAAPFDRNGAVKQIYLSPVSDDFAAELLDEFGDRWPPAAFTNGGGPLAADWHDARAVLVKLVGQPLTTLRGRPNRILEVGEADVIVATDRAPEGQPVPILWVQQALDQLVRDSEAIISPEVVGYRSAFIGAVLRTLPGVAVGMDPPRVWLEGAQDDTETSGARQRQPDDGALTGQLLEAITELRRWTRDGKAAVHKPLLLLLALERVRRGLPRLVSFADIEAQLRGLITEFSPTPGPSHPEYPFWRLQGDGLWDVPEASQLPSRASNSDPPVSVLRARRVQGGLPILFDQLLRARGDVLDQAVTTTLQHFPPELRPRVLERLGWDDIPTRPARRPRSSEQMVPLGVPYREGSLAASRSSSTPYQPDPDKVGRGLEGHELTLRALVSAVQACGLEPLLPGSTGPSYDLAWETDTTIFVAEVKSLTLANEERQLRLGLGQVLRYWHALSHHPKPVIAVLAVEERPADESWLTLCGRLGIWLLWPETMPAAVADAVQGKETLASAQRRPTVETRLVAPHGVPR